MIPRERILIIDEKREDKLDLLFTLLGECIGDTYLEKHKDQIWRNLMERELSMSTGIGMGVAVPHCSSEHVRDVMAYMALVRSGIDFQAIDDEPVKIIILLLMPKNKFEKHIKTLASVARIFNNTEFRNKILSAKDAAHASAIIIDETPAQ